MSRFEGPQGIVTNGLVLNLDAGNPDSYTRSQPPYVEVLVVAGGGGGSGNYYDDGAGGGAGGLIYNSAYQITNAAGITVTIGAGGAASVGSQGGDGGNSVFGSLTAIGGGGGGGHRGSGRSGGSGGGSCGAYASTDTTLGGAGTPGQGFAGGTSVYRSYAGSGGGGAGGVGGTSSEAVGGNGANGQTYSISGTSTYYAGGGGGYGYSHSSTATGGLGGGGNGGNPSPLAPTAGGTNTGGGGGGGRTVGQVPFVGTAAGGSGIVIVRYPGLPAATGGTITYLNGYTIHTFTSSGTFTPYLWNDLSGGGRNGTLVNGVGFIPYQNGGIMRFDGVDDYAIITSTTNPSEYTIHFFCQWISSVGFSERLFGSDAFGTYTIFNPYDVGFHYNPLGGSPPSVTLSSGVNVGFGNWCQVAVTVSTSSSNVVIYVNGIARNSWSVIPSQNLYSDIFLGAQNTSLKANCYFGGFQLYDRVLSAAEITQNFNAQRARFGI